MHEFIETIVKKEFKNRALISHQIETKTYPQFNTDEFIKSFQDEIKHKVSAALSEREPLGIEEASIYDDIEAYQIHAIEVREYKESGGLIWISFHVNWTTSVQGFIPKSELHRLDDGDPVTITDFNWNDHVAEVEAQLPMLIQISVLLNFRDAEVAEFEVDLL